MDVTTVKEGDMIGIPWLGYTCGNAAVLSLKRVGEWRQSELQAA